MTVKEFGQFLFLLRTGKGLSLSEVSRETGVDRYLLDRLERGVQRSFPAYKTLSTLSDFYEFRFQYIPEQLLIIAPSISVLPFQQQEERIDEFKNHDGEYLMTMAEGEEILIRRALDQTDFNRERAADILKIALRTLYRKIKQYNIKKER